MSRPTPDHASPVDEPVADTSRRRKRRTAWFAAGVLVLLLSLYAAAVAVAGDRIAKGTHVAGVQIGGLTATDAAATLRTELLPRADDPIEVSVSGDVFSFAPARLGLQLDVDATVARAGGGTKLDPYKLWTSFFGGDRVDPVVRVRQDKLIGALRSLAERTGRPAVEPAVTFAGDRPVLRQPEAGVRLDVGRSAVAVSDAWLVSERTVELPVTETPAGLRPAELQAGLAQARGMVADPVTLRLPGGQVQLAPRRYAPALSLQLADGQLQPTVDPQQLAGRLPSVIGAARTAPRNATVELVGGRPQVVPARPGAVAEPRAVANAVLSAATSTGERTARVPGEQVKADFTTREARELGIDEVVSDFTTYYPHEDYRNTNIGRAAELINGTVLRPGQPFSLNDTVGERTAANDFVKGFIISNGVFAEDYGGGVSQVATTTFNAAFFAGLEDVEHEPHSFYIDRYPVGREATVAWPTIDLRFANDTPYGVLIRAWIKPSVPGGTGEMHVQMWSTKYWDIEARRSQRYDYTQPSTRTSSDEGCVPMTGYAGFEIDVYRDFYRPGSDEKVRTERFHTEYTPADTVICN